MKYKLISVLSILFAVGFSSSARANLIENEDVFCAFPPPCVGACEPYRYLHKKTCEGSKFQVDELNSDNLKEISKIDPKYGANLKRAKEFSDALGEVGMSAFTNKQRNHDEIDSFIKWQANRKNKQGKLTKDMWCDAGLVDPLRNLITRSSAEVDINQANKFIVRSLASNIIPDVKDLKPWYGFNKDFEYNCNQSTNIN